MLGIPFILATARAILTHSKAIQGRVWVAPFNASELNAPNLEQAVADTILGTERKQYPLSLILPPVLSGDLVVDGWKNYLVRQLFLKQEGRTSAGDIQQQHPLTNTSQHTIVQDWHDMSRCAQGFMRALGKAQGNDLEFRRRFRISESAPGQQIPITRLGNDKCNGVMITYTVGIYEGCVTEDYNDGWEADLVLPNGDQHAEHQL